MSDINGIRSQLEHLFLILNNIEGLPPEMQVLQQELSHFFTTHERPRDTMDLLERCSSAARWLEMTSLSRGRHSASGLFENFFFLSGHRDSLITFFKAHALGQKLGLTEGVNQLEVTFNTSDQRYDDDKDYIRRRGIFRIADLIRPSRPKTAAAFDAFVGSLSSEQAWLINALLLPHTRGSKGLETKTVDAEIRKVIPTYGNILSHRSERVSSQARDLSFTEGPFGLTSSPLKPIGSGFAVPSKGADTWPNILGSLRASPLSGQPRLFMSLPDHEIMALPPVDTGAMELTMPNTFNLAVNLLRKAPNGNEVAIGGQDWLLFDGRENNTSGTISARQARTGQTFILGYTQKEFPTPTLMFQTGWSSEGAEASHTFVARGQVAWVPGYSIRLPVDDVAGRLGKVIPTRRDAIKEVMGEIQRSGMYDAGEIKDTYFKIGTAGLGNLSQTTVVDARSMELEWEEDPTTRMVETEVDSSGTLIVHLRDSHAKEGPLRLPPKLYALLWRPARERVRRETWRGESQALAAYALPEEPFTPTEGHARLLAEAVAFVEGKPHYSSLGSFVRTGVGNPLLTRWLTRGLRHVEDDWLTGGLLPEVQALSTMMDEELSPQQIVLANAALYLSAERGAPLGSRVVFETLTRIRDDAPLDELTETDMNEDELGENGDAGASLEASENIFSGPGVPGGIARLRPILRPMAA